MSNDRPAPKQYETWLKQLQQQRFEQARFKVEKEFAVGELPLRIDMIVRAEAAAAFSELPEIYRHFRRHNVMEFKSEADDLTAEDLLKLHAYGWLYMELNHIYMIHEVTLTALVHHLTPAVLSVLPTLGYLPTREGHLPANPLGDGVAADLLQRIAGRTDAGRAATFFKSEASSTHYHVRAGAR